jgi:alanine dehydrogenase
MRVYSAMEVAERLPYLALIDRLREAFTQSIQTPMRSLYRLGPANGTGAELGIMPAWQSAGSIAVKIFTIFPDNPANELPAIHAQILLLDGSTGAPTAVVDGTEVTRRRTAASSALAASFLARKDSDTLLIVGTGAQAAHQALAHAAVLPIRRVGIWGRSSEKAAIVARSLSLRSTKFSVEVIEDLEAAARQSDVITCVTRASEPIIFGEWLKAGTFLDLVGSHSPQAREADDQAVQRASVFVDTFEGAMAEAGDILIPLRRGVIRESDIRGDLRALCQGDVPGRRTSREVTLFKSVGTGLEDLAAACMVAAAG